MAARTKRPPDKTLTARVARVRNDLMGFMVMMGDGSEQWFRLGNRAEGCPDQDMEIRIQYNVSPGNDEYPDPTWWCNEWVSTRNGAQPEPPTPTSEPNPYEAKAQEIEAAEQAQGAAPAHSGAIRRFETNESIAMQVCIKAVVEAQMANLSAAVSSQHDEAMTMLLTPEAIAGEAEELYQRVFLAPLVDQDDGDEPEREYRGA